MYDYSTTLDTDLEYATDDLVEPVDGSDVSSLDTIEEPWFDDYSDSCCEPPPDPCGWESDPSLDPTVWDTPPVVDAPAVLDTPAMPASQLAAPVAPLPAPDVSAVIPAGQPGGPVAPVEFPLPVETSSSFGPTVMPTGSAFAAEPGPLATTMSMATAYAAEPSPFATTMPMAPAFDTDPGPFATTYHVATTPPPLADIYVKAANNGDLLQQAQILGLMGHDSRISWLPTSWII